MSSNVPVFYRVSVSCLFISYKDNELKILVRKKNCEGPKLPETGMTENSMIEDTAHHMAAGYLNGYEYYMRQIGAFEAEDSTGRNELTVMYYALTRHEHFHAERYPDFEWCSIAEASLNRMQKETLTTAFKRIRRKISMQPIAFFLLPELFTLSQFQHLYEEVLQAPVDKRNFRKRICEMDYIEQTELIDKSSSKRGAHLYAFNQNAYNKSKIPFKL